MRQRLRILGIDRHRPRIEVCCLFEQSDVEQDLRQEIECLIQVGAFFKRGCDLADRVLVIETALRRPGETAADVASFGDVRVELQRAVASFAGAFVPAAVGIPSDREPVVGIRQPEERKRFRRIDLVRFLEELDRCIHVGHRLVKQRQSPFEPEVEKISTNLRTLEQPLFIGRRQFQLKGLDHFSGDLVLHGENIVESGVDLDRPERTFLGGTHHLHGDAQTRSGALNSASDHSVDAKLAGRGNRVFAFVAQDCCSRPDEQRAN